MRFKEIDALFQVHGGLFDLKRALFQVTEKLEERLGGLGQLQEKTAAAQRRLQKIALALTVVIALATVSYTWVTWQTVRMQQEANEIQREALALRLESGVEEAR